MVASKADTPLSPPLASASLSTSHLPSAFVSLHTSVILSPNTFTTVYPPAPILGSPAGSHPSRTPPILLKCMSFPPASDSPLSVLSHVLLRIKHRYTFSVNASASHPPTDSSIPLHPSGTLPVLRSTCPLHLLPPLHTRPRLIYYPLSPSLYPRLLFSALYHAFVSVTEPNHSARTDVKILYREYGSATHLPHLHIRHTSISLWHSLNTGMSGLYFSDCRYSIPFVINTSTKPAKTP